MAGTGYIPSVPPTYTYMCQTCDSRFYSSQRRIWVEVCPKCNEIYFKLEKEGAEDMSFGFGGAYVIPTVPRLPDEMPKTYEYRCKACNESFTCEIAPTKEMRTRVCPKCIGIYSKVDRYFRLLRKKYQPKEEHVPS